MLVQESIVPCRSGNGTQEPLVLSVTKVQGDSKPPRRTSCPTEAFLVKRWSIQLLSTVVKMTCILIYIFTTCRLYLNRIKRKSK